jgi:hypothetical protein
MRSKKGVGASCSSFRFSSWALWGTVVPRFQASRINPSFEVCGIYWFKVNPGFITTWIMAMERQLFWKEQASSRGPNLAAKRNSVLYFNTSDGKGSKGMWVQNQASSTSCLLRSARVWDITQQRVAVLYRRCWKIYGSHLQGPVSPRRKGLPHDAA